MTDAEAFMALLAGGEIVSLQQQAFCTATAPQGGVANDAKTDDGIEANLGPAFGGNSFDALIYDFAGPRLITGYSLNGYSVRQGGFFRTGTVYLYYGQSPSGPWTLFNSHAADNTSVIDVPFQTLNVIARCIRLELASFGTADSYVFLDMLEIRGEGD